MDRINKIGKILINYKNEYSKHYSSLVDESLITCLEGLLEKKMLTQDIFNQIIDDGVSNNDFEKIIGNNREYIKSQKELLDEFERIRTIVNNALSAIDFTQFIETESNLEINKISILRQYSISEEFIKVYFGLEDEDMEQIMKKKGFAEKFAVLRLTKIFKEIFSEMRSETEFTQGFSRVYYNSDVKGFSVDYKYHLPVDLITAENIEAKVKRIKEVDKVVERKYLKKTGMSFYNLNEIKDTNQSLDIQKNAPNSKFTSVDVKEEETNKIVSEIKNDIVEENPIEEKPIIQNNKIENKPNKPKNIDKKPPFDNSKRQINEQKNNVQENKDDKVEDYLGNSIEVIDTLSKINDNIEKVTQEDDIFDMNENELSLDINTDIDIQDGFIDDSNLDLDLDFDLEEIPVDTEGDIEDI